MSYYLNVDNIDNAWEVLMAELYSQKEDFCLDSRDGVVVGELLNACITIKDPTRCILKSRKRKMPTRYAIGEEELNWNMKKGAWPIRMGMC